MVQLTVASSNLGFIDVSMGLGSPETPSLGGAGPEPGEGECVPMSLRPAVPGGLMLTQPWEQLGSA